MQRLACDSLFVWLEKRWVRDLGNYLFSPRCQMHFVLMRCFSCLMVKGEESLAEEVSNSPLSSGSSSEVTFFVWCYCDKLFCWFLGIANGGLSQYLCLFVGRGNPCRDNGSSPRESIMFLR